MQSYKWLHLYAFSTVSSNCLPEQMQSRIDCICMLFSRVSFQMCPQIACLYRCKVALVAFVCFFKCLLRLSARPDAKSNLLHLYAFLKWLFKCVCLSPQIVCPNRCKVAFIAFVCFSQVTFQMCPQVVCLYRCKVALVAFVRFFSRVSFQMCPQIACLYRCIVALVAFVRFFSRVSF